MSEEIKGLVLAAAFVAVLGGIASAILGTVLGAVTGVIGMEAVVGGVIALALLLLIKQTTEVEKYDLFDFVVLLVAVGIVGTLITMLVPAASGWIITLGGNWSANVLAWTFVYIGIAFMAKKWILEQL